jgi:hypothetical protein
VEQSRVAQNDDLEHRFVYHKPDEAKVKSHERVRGHLQGMALYFDEVLPDGREKAIVMTKLEEAMFWANAAIARQR